MKKLIGSIVLLGFCASAFSGCWLVAGAAGGEGGYVASQENKTAGQTVDDQVTSSSIKTRLLADPEVSGLKIDVDVDKGVATLRGFVKSTHELDRAVELTRMTSGVKAVDSRLVVDSKS